MRTVHTSMTSTLIFQCDRIFGKKLSRMFIFFGWCFQNACGKKVLAKEKANNLPEILLEKVVMISLLKKKTGR